MGGRVLPWLRTIPREAAPLEKIRQNLVAHGHQRRTAAGFAFVLRGPGPGLAGGVPCPLGVFGPAFGGLHPGPLANELQVAPAVGEPGLPGGPRRGSQSLLSGHLRGLFFAQHPGGPTRSGWACSPGRTAPARRWRPASFWRGPWDSWPPPWPRLSAWCCSPA